MTLFQAQGYETIRKAFEMLLTHDTFEAAILVNVPLPTKAYLEVDVVQHNSMDKRIKDVKSLSKYLYLSPIHIYESLGAEALVSVTKIPNVEIVL